MNRRTIFITTVSLVFLLAVTVLAVFAANSSNVLTEFKVHSLDPQGKANTHYQLLSWSFTRPVNPEQRAELAKLITFSPEIPGNFKLINNTVVFSPAEILRYGQEYQVNISEKLQDIYRKQLAQTYELKFTSKELKFLTQRPASTGYDLLLNTVNKQPETIVAAQKIKEFAADYSGQRIAYTIQEFDQQASKLYSYDQATKVVKEVVLGRSLNISGLQFDRYGNLVFIGAIPDAELAQIVPEEMPEIVTRPYKYDFVTAKLVELEMLKNHYGDIMTLRVVPDGNSVLLQKFNSDQVIVSLLNGDSTTIGRYNGVAGFDYLGTKLGLLEIDFSRAEVAPQTQIYADSKIIFKTEAAVFTQDPNLATSGKFIVYAKRLAQLDYYPGVFGLEARDLAGNRLLAFSEAGASLELPNISPDGQLLIAERYSKDVISSQERTVRRYVNAGRPESSNMVVFRMPADGVGLQKLAELGNSYNLCWVF